MRRRMDVVRIVSAIAMVVALLGSSFVMAPPKVSAQTGPGGVGSGLQLWLDAADLATLYSDAACTTAVTADGQDVACWQDKSGQNAHVTQVTGLGIPTYRTNQFNDQPALEFFKDQSDTLRHVLASSWNSEYTLFVVFEQQGTPVDYDSFFSNGDSPTDAYFQIAQLSGAYRWLSNPDQLDFEPFSNELKLYTVVGDAANTTTYADNVQTDTGATTNGRQFTQYRINQNRNSDRLSNAKIPEVILYNRALSACDLETVSVYLGDKYGRDFFDIGAKYTLSEPETNDVNGIGSFPSDCGGELDITTAASDIATMYDPSALDLNDFQTFAHDGAGYTLSSQVPAGYDARLLQRWRVDADDGDVGTVSLRFDLSGVTPPYVQPGYALLVDADGDFSDATVLTGAVTSGQTVTFDNVDFSHEDYFTLAFVEANAPPVADFGDAPVTYGTLLADDGARHGFATRIQQVDIEGPAGSGQFGRPLMLPNGNLVVVDPLWDDGATQDVGAVYLYDGVTLNLISRLTGSTAGDEVGKIMSVLPNGNFVVISPRWDNGVITDAGAVTWVDGTTGLTGTVSTANSLYGTQTADLVGVTGAVVHPNTSHYVVGSPAWDNGSAVNVGATTWVSGSNGHPFGESSRGVAVSTSNSLIGNSANDYAGSTCDVGFTATCNGASFKYGLDSLNLNDYRLGGDKFLIRSPHWHSGSNEAAGAVTLMPSTGMAGTITAANSLVGSSTGDRIGRVVAFLPNGNYVVRAPFWDLSPTITDAGAVIWGSYTSGITGEVSTTNALHGSTSDDRIGSAPVVALSNGNYVAASPGWNNGAADNAGAATWVDGSNGHATGETGPGAAVSSANSLVGSSPQDEVSGEVLIYENDGTGVIALSNGNYVVGSDTWDNGDIANAGAATWGDGLNGTSGVVTTTNSLVGTSADDGVSSGVIAPLVNGNYVVSSPDWDGANADVGAVTWVDGGNGHATGASGPGAAVSTSNSLYGATADDSVGSGGVAALLINGNYVVNSPVWDNGGTANVGAVTWGDGSVGITGAVGTVNSLYGVTANDRVGSGEVPALNRLANGNYVAVSPLWDNGSTADTGAVTWMDGATGLTGAVSTTNSFVGSSANERLGDKGYFGDAGVAPLTDGNYVVSSLSWNGGVGAVAWRDGTSSTAGVISAANALVGNSVGDLLLTHPPIRLPNGQYLVSGDGATGPNNLTWSRSVPGLIGPIAEPDTVFADNAGDLSFGTESYSELLDILAVGRPSDNIITIMRPVPITLGALRDAEADGFVSAAADGDDKNNLDDEEGVTFNPAMGSATANVVLAGVGNTLVVTASVDGVLNAWIDYNQDGEFADAAEHIYDEERVGPGANTLTFTPPSSTPGGETYARFRLTSAAGMANTPTGAADDGEVEDYALTIVALGTIIIEKQTAPSGGTGFGFTQDIDASGAFTLDDGQTKTFVEVLPGSYNVTEDEPDLYRLTGLSCDDGTSATPSTVDVAARTATIELDPGETVTCTFTNSEDDLIVIEKSTYPAGGTGFEFSHNLDQSGNFFLDDGDLAIFTSAPGNRTITELDPSPAYDITGIECLVYGPGDTVPTVVTGDLATGSVDLTLSGLPGSAVFCSFENTQRGSLTIVKNTVGGDGSFDFTSNTLTPSSFSLTTTGGTAQQVFADLAPGTYDVAETVPDGWALTSATCDDGSDPSSITLDAGEDLTCTFTNAAPGSLTVIKEAVGGDGSFDFTSPQLGDFSLTTVGGTAQQTFDTLAPGTYGLGEIPTAGWDLIGATCSDGSLPGNVSLEGGESVTCTFTNQKRSSLTVVKNTVGGDGIFDFTSSELGDFSLTTVSGTAQQVFTDLPSGPYAVAETVPDGWDLTSTTCDNGDTPDSVNLGVGEDVICTFENTKASFMIYLPIVLRSYTP